MQVRQKWLILVLAAAGLLGAARASAEAPTYGPHNIQATGVSQTEIDLSWDAVIAYPDVTGYRIDRENGIGGGFTTIVTNTNSNATTYADKNLSPNSLYNYRLYAINGDGTGSGSLDQAAALTKSPQFSAAPNAPQGLKTTAVSGSEIDLSWSAPSAGATVDGYKVERENGIGGGFTAIVASTPNLSYADTNLAIGATYNYRVSGVNNYGAGVPSVSAFATTLTLPGPPRIAQANPGDGQATVTWLAPYGNQSITSYVILGLPSGSSTVVGSATSANITGLTNGINYYFTVSAVNALGQGPGTNTNYVTPAVSVVPVIPPPASPPPSSAYIFKTTLERGMQGNAVMELQKRLVAAGFLKATPNGTFGPMTFAAVKAYQKAHGISQTGAVGPLTRASLNK